MSNENGGDGNGEDLAVREWDLPPLPPHSVTFPCTFLLCTTPPLLLSAPYAATGTISHPAPGAACRRLLCRTAHSLLSPSFATISLSTPSFTQPQPPPSSIPYTKSNPHGAQLQTDERRDERPARRAMRRAMRQTNRPEEFRQATSGRGQQAASNKRGSGRWCSL